MPNEASVLRAQVLQRSLKGKGTSSDNIVVRGFNYHESSICVTENRITLSTRGVLQQTFLCNERILQIAFCHFGPSRLAQICVLQPKSLTLFGVHGGTHVIPLPSLFTALFPIEEGLLLTGAEDTGSKALMHPSEDIQALPTEYKSIVGNSHTEPSSGWRGEVVVWIGAVESPYALTYNKAKLKRTVANSPASGSGLKRPSIRLPDGSLSPAAFSPVPVCSATAALPAVPLLPTAPLPFTVQLIAERGVAEGSGCPSEAVLHHDLYGGCLLAILFKEARSASIVRLPNHEAATRSGVLEVVGEVQAMSIAAIQRLPLPVGKAPSNTAERSVRQNLLVLEPNGQLKLLVGDSMQFGVTLPITGTEFGEAEPSNMQARPDDMEIGTPTVSADPSPSRPEVRGSPSSDVSMDTAGSLNMDVVMISPGTSDQRRDLPSISALKGAGGGRAVLLLENGHEICFSVDFLPKSERTRTAIAALAHSIPFSALEQIIGSIHKLDACEGMKYLNSPWSLFSDALLDWAETKHRMQSPQARSSSHSETGGRKHGQTDGSSAWEILQSSKQHRTILASNAFQWLGEEGKGQPELEGGSSALHGSPFQGQSVVFHALLGLHCMYEDWKLNKQKWNSLHEVCHTLARLADIEGASQYLQRYRHEFGKADHEAASARLSLQSTFETDQPGSIYNAAIAILMDQAHELWLSKPFKDGPAYLQRSCDILLFYSILSQKPGSAAHAYLEAAGKGADQRRHALVLAMAGKGWTQAKLCSLPFGISYPLRLHMEECRVHPPSGWPIEAYQLIGRTDIVANIIDREESDTVPRNTADSNTRGVGNPIAAAVYSKTPLTKPQLRTPFPGGQQKTRMSLGGDSVIAAAATQATSTPVQPSTRKDTEANQPRMRNGLPYAERIDLPGIEWEDFCGGDEAATTESDGMESLDAVQKKQRFGPDLRLLEVRKLLRSSNPTALHIKDASTAGDVEVASLQQKRLMALGVRTMALPVGRAALTLGTLKPLPTEPLSIQQLNLSGLLPEQQNAVVKLDLALTAPAPGGGATADFTAWPEFHNGVAAGLRLASGGPQMTRTWVVYNKPAEPSYTHAGMLMGLGLTGHLNCLAATDLYRYLSQEHDATTTGVLLGMAAAKRGTSDQTISKMLFLHLPSRFPPLFPELELSSLVQSAALLGVGLLYEGSCHRLTAEMMLEEIGRRPTSEYDHKTPSFQGISDSGNTISADREGYALSAGLALGLICLGHGRNAAGLADMRIEDRLKFYMMGGKDPRASSRSGKHLETIISLSQGRPETGAMGFDPTRGGELPWSQPAPSPRNHRNPSNPSGAAGQSQLVIENNIPNLDVTAPGGILGLALMYLQTNDQSIAALFHIPSTTFDLDFVRPDFILLRMLARCLVMWDDVKPTTAWMDAQLPPLISGSQQEAGWPPEGSTEQVEPQLEDPEAVAQAQVHAVSGACLAMGIRYAGTANPEARKTLLDHVSMYLKWKMRAPDPFAGATAVWGRVDKQSLENCMNIIALGLALVMAGTGDLETLSLFRGLRRRMSQGPFNTAGAVFYGNHVAISMCLGFLFYGAGSKTFSTSKSSVAALVISLFPRLPLSPSDNRCHLQAFRHLHVLASEDRCVTAQEVDSQEDVKVPVSWKKADESSAEEVQLTPCLFPSGSEQLKTFSVGGQKHYPLHFHGADPALQSILKSGKVHVQRRPEDRVSSLDIPKLSTLPGLSDVDKGDKSAADALLAALDDPQQNEDSLTVQSLCQSLSSSDVRGSLGGGVPLAVIQANLNLAIAAASKHKAETTEPTAARAPANDDEGRGSNQLASLQSLQHIQLLLEGLQSRP